MKAMRLFLSIIFSIFHQNFVFMETWFHVDCQFFQQNLQDMLASKVRLDFFPI